MNYPEWILEFVKDLPQEDRDKYLLSYRSILNELVCITPEVDKIISSYYNSYKEFKSLTDSIGETVTFAKSPRLKLTNI